MAEAINELEGVDGVTCRTGCDCCGNCNYLKGPRSREECNTVWQKIAKLTSWYDDSKATDVSNEFYCNENGQFTIERSQGVSTCSDIAAGIDALIAPQPTHTTSIVPTMGSTAADANKPIQPIQPTQPIQSKVAGSSNSINPINPIIAIKSCGPDFG